MAGPFEQIPPPGTAGYYTTFQETRSATATVLANHLHTYELSPQDFETQTAGAGAVAYQSTSGVTRLSISGAAGDAARIRSAYAQYRAGHCQRARITLVQSDAGVAGQVRRWGVFDEHDGLFFQVAGTTLSVGVRSSVSGTPTDTLISKSSWNGPPFAGVAPPAFPIDVTKGSVWEIEYQWLSVGDVRFFVNGLIVHTISNMNIIAGPYMRTGVLPVEVEIENTGASAAASVGYICSEIHTEGGGEIDGTAFGAFVGADKTVSTTEAPLLSARPAASFRGLTNRKLIYPLTLSISCAGAAADRLGYRVVINPSGALTTPSWAAADSASAVEYDTTSSSFIGAAGGQTIYRGVLAQGKTSERIDLRPYFATLGRKLAVSPFATGADLLCVTGIQDNSSGGALPGVRASLTWTEKG